MQFRQGLERPNKGPVSLPPAQRSTTILAFGVLGRLLIQRRASISAWRDSDCKTPLKPEPPFSRAPGQGDDRPMETMELPTTRPQYMALLLFGALLLLFFAGRFFRLRTSGHSFFGDKHVDKAHYLPWYVHSCPAWLEGFNSSVVVIHRYDY